MTPGQRWRSRRNLLIADAHRNGGYSQRFLADVFDLPRSSIGAIVAGVEAAAEDVAEKLRASDPPAPRSWRDLRADRSRKIARPPRKRG